MLFRVMTLATVSMALVGSVYGADDQKKDSPKALKYTMKNIDGKDVSLSDYQGKVILIVNVASQCGLTPQYKGLQALYEKYNDKGLGGLGVPCNQFGRQEPGSDADIKAFCSDNYSVSFPMFSKIEVNGKEQADLYKHLTSLDLKPASKGDIKWNFEKFVIDRNGAVVARFSPRTRPSDADLVKTIETALAK